VAKPDLLLGPRAFRRPSCRCHSRGPGGSAGGGGSPKLEEQPHAKQIAHLSRLSITGGKDLTLYEVDEAASRIREEVDADANIIVGATFEESLDGIIRVSVVATGVTSMRPTMSWPNALVANR
jgi:hypothetical protein